MKQWIEVMKYLKTMQGVPRINGTVVMENYRPTKEVLNTAVSQLIKTRR